MAVITKTKQERFMQEHKRVVEKDAALKKDDWIVITGAGGFIAGHLALYFKKKGFTNVRAADKKPLYEWYARRKAGQRVGVGLEMQSLSSAASGVQPLAVALLQRS